MISNLLKPSGRRLNIRTGYPVSKVDKTQKHELNFKRTPDPNSAGGMSRAGITSLVVCSLLLVGGKF